MFTNIEIKDYDTLNKMLKSLIEDETDRIANLSNASSLLNYFLKDINWVGFYLYDESSNELVLGPFQGLPACVRIENGKGVCGTAFRGNDIFIVDDVNEFPGHIACDANSKSEIVLPLYKDGKGIGVLDIDAPILERFTEEDRSGLKAFVETLIDYI
ncbi:Free methionine-R-sulfoxide reductase [Jeotgalicoccus aerolatus]|jgi:L-methionine (R)-S-oxide reductase|uniref:GAF domain-containing protein n=1 Tax=Jeotgalicoccus aerolatus TaxID=709510 RepID=A0A1G9EH58_9STAP|nr:GAF domain-containing protein [Jeotgalicoccus aerolatus]MBP1952538.1 GAF domain-containing protein [Jeotgalicoccus aerolatus]NMA80348.1 GAF domain-containing protein [Jeotgalicoccus aerolatus]CAD2074573.1 Free methionine-R-sulfoxide reductase [Jeotgalicoccus aerolatus]SDK75479.1 GAF domain-containing protein [Jeotgalicoccus aerolatus]GGD92926.1 protein YtsP [Jeotgalicoccus aerolatus]